MKTPSLKALFAASLVAVAACSDGTSTEPVVTSAAPPELHWSRPPSYMARFVAIGTSISMGWGNDGVFWTSQDNAWTKQLASFVGVPFTVPGIEAPGCQPPLMAPLIAFRRVDGTGPGRSTVCSPNVAGVTLPTSNLAVENATAAEALNATPATASAGRGPVTSRVLPPGMTQVTAMESLNPTFVSVELGGNEILPAQVGVVIPGLTYTPFATFQANYAQVIDAVRGTGARAVLVSIRTDLRRFPTIRTGREIASQRAAFAAYNVTVNIDCDASANYIFVRGKVLTAIATGAGRAQAGLGPYDLSCADVPNTQDFVLSPAEMTFLNDLQRQMSDEIERQARANGYAVFPLGVLYNISKVGVPFDLEKFLKSGTPYGELIGLDGVHPSAKGQTLLAIAARVAIGLRYGVGDRRGHD